VRAGSLAPDAAELHTDYILLYGRALPSPELWTRRPDLARLEGEALASLGYEAEQNGFSGNLGPTDGFISVGLGAEYTQGNISVAGGVRYVSIGNAQTQLGGPVTSTFDNNDAVAVGVRVGFQF